MNTSLPMLKGEKVIMLVLQALEQNKKQQHD